MSDDKPSNIEPRYSKYDTLKALFDARVRNAAACRAVREAEKAQDAVAAECSLLEQEASPRA
ncbi:MAG: hypothetical protein ACTS5I_16985 [Rhodanobacter sp.]